MKHRLLAAISLCAATSSTMPLWAAVNVEEPSIEQSETLDEEQGGSYYLFNIGTEMFLTAGNAWNTQASIGTTGHPITIAQTYDEASGLSGMTLMYPRSIATANGGKPNYLYITLEGGAFIDYNLVGSYLWKVMKQDNGNYRIQIIDEDPLYGYDATNVNGYLGHINNDYNSEEVDNTIVQPLINIDAMDEFFQEKAHIDWALVTEDNYNLYVAKKELYKVLERADAEGYTETSAYETIYNKEGVTCDELNNAALELTDKIDVFVYGQASEEHPIDLTLKIQNASFGDGTYNSTGWVLNGMWGNGATLPVENSDRSMMAFTEAWVAGPGVLGDVSVMQTIKGLPGGKYKLYADMNAVQQAAPDTETKGVYLCADGGFGEVSTEFKITQCNGVGREVALTFSLIDGKDLVIGARTEDCNFNWFAVDNFRLEFVGMLTDIDLAKDELMRSAEESYSYYDMQVVQNGFLCSNKGRENLLSAIDLANEAIANPDISIDSLVSLRNMVNAQYDAIKYDIEIYNNGEIQLKLDEKYLLINDNPAYADDEFFFNKTAAYIDETLQALDNLEFDPNDYSKIDAVVDSLMRDDIFEAVNAGITNNVTGLFRSTSFDNNSAAGWDGAFTNVLYGVAESFNTTFDISQTVENLPEGTYRITMNGFCRPGSNDICSNGTEEDNRIYSYLYGNESNQQIVHLYDNLFDEPPFLNEDGNSSYKLESTNEELNGKYVVDDLQCFEVVLKNDPTLYLNEIRCFVSDGTLKIGVKTIGTPVNYGHWTAFDNFKIEYLGKDDLSGYKSTVESLIAEVDAKLAVNESVTDPSIDPSIPSEVEAEIKGVRTSAYNDIVASESFAVDAALSYITSLKNASALADSALECSNELIAEFSLAIERSSAMQEVEYEGYFTCMAEYEAVAPAGFSTIDEVNQWIMRFRKEYTAMMVYGKTDSASKENPSDLTSAIINPGFEIYDDVTGETTYTAEGWDNAGAANASEVEFWNRNFNMSQTICGLPSGYYRLDVSGFYRNGDGITAAVKHRDGIDTLHAMVYAEGAAVTYAKPLMSICDGATDESMGAANINIGDSLYTGDDIENAPAKYVPNAMEDAQISFQNNLYENELYFAIDEGQECVTIGIRKDVLVPADWTIFDNFRLYYYGSGDENMPDGVGDIEDGKPVVVTSSYYTIGGVQIAKPVQRGIYLRKDKMSDGTEKTLKIMVR